MIEKVFTWRGLGFVWNGRRRRWSCERPGQQSADWWVTWHTYNQSFLMREGNSISWDNPPEDFMPGTFANAGWMAHFGFGDAALRPTRDEALLAALEYSVRFHAASLAQLRPLLRAPELCQEIAWATTQPLYCEYVRGHEGYHSWQPQPP